MKTILSLTTAILCAGCSDSGSGPAELANPGKVLFAGVRSSSYGITPFPEPSGWEKVIGKMGALFQGAAPSALWIVGTAKAPRSVQLEFPGDAASHPDTEFAAEDKHERYLSAFDKAGFKVFLQVESGSADLGALIDLVLSRYKRHPCVVGFGVDVEWYREVENPGHGVKVDDATAQAWEAKVKAHNASYRLVLKHWDKLWMPPTFRGDIIFLDDSQGFADQSQLLAEFSDWGKVFHPAMVGFQIGYQADQRWWSTLSGPPASLGESLRKRMAQDIAIVWVDFTLKDVLPLD